MKSEKTSSWLKIDSSSYWTIKFFRLTQKKKWSFRISQNRIIDCSNFSSKNQLLYGEGGYIRLSQWLGDDERRRGEEEITSLNLLTDIC